MEYDNLLISGQTDRTSLVANTEPVHPSGINRLHRIGIRDFGLALQESAPWIAV